MNHTNIDFQSQAHVDIMSKIDNFLDISKLPPRCIDVVCVSITDIVFAL